MKPGARLTKWDSYLRKRSRSAITAVAGASIVGLGAVDSATGTQFSLAVFYLLPIALATWYGGKQEGLLIALASAMVWLVADFSASDGFEHPTIPFWESLVRLTLFVIVVYLLTAIKRLNENLQSTVDQKTAALQAEMQERSRVEQTVLAISSEEQRRLAHELHDGLGQALTYSALKAKMLAEDLTVNAPAQAQQAREIVALLNRGTQQIRHVARGLDPIDIEACGLTAALDRLVRDTESLEQVRCGFTFSRSELRLAPSANLQLYRIAQEALNNAIRHAKGKNVEVELDVGATEVSLSVKDDGIGFIPGAVGASGMGIRIMRYRARSLNGVFDIDSTPGEGATIRCTVPLASESPGAIDRPKDIPGSPKYAAETHSRG